MSKIGSMMPVQINENDDSTHDLSENQIELLKIEWVLRNTMYLGLGEFLGGVSSGLVGD